MRAQSPWPVRYRVTIHPVTGQARDVLVITWLGPEKAVMMAVHSDGRGYGTGNGIYDIGVEVLGPADADDRGLVAINDHLVDRMEF